MRRLLEVAVILGLAIFAAAAQDANEQKADLVRELKLQAERLTFTVANEGVMAQPVQGAPYAATEVNETDQTLADGTRIHNEHQSQVYRDGAGRTRREMGNSIVIMDPVAKVRYSINTEHKTAVAMPVNFVGKVLADGVVTITSPNVGLAVAKEPANVMFARDGEMGQFRVRQEAKANREDLGPQTMEGVVAQGTRTTRTIEAGAIGNDRPISITSERWYSPQLQTVMMTKQNDPRSGENTFRLTNVRLGEPDPSLFQVPAGYQVTERR